MVSRRLPAFALALATFALSACAALSKELGQLFEKPVLNFVRADINDLSLESAGLDLVFEIENPNRVGLDLAKLAYQLEIDNHLLVSGTPALGLKIPAKQTSQLVFPARVKFADLASGLEAALSKEESTYRASGEVGLNTPVGLVSLPISAQGAFKNPRLPVLGFEPPRVTNLNLTGAKVIVPLRIQNPNAFPLPLARLSGALAIAGVAVGHASASGPAIPPQQARALEIGLDLNFLSTGLAVATALNQGAGDLKLDGTLGMGGIVLPVHLTQRVNFRQP